MIGLLRAELPDGLDSGRRKQNVAWPNYSRLILCPFAISPEVGSVDSELEQKDNLINFLIQDAGLKKPILYAGQGRHAGKSTHSYCLSLIFSLRHRQYSQRQLWQLKSEILN